MRSVALQWETHSVAYVSSFVSLQVYEDTVFSQSNDVTKIKVLEERRRLQQSFNLQVSWSQTPCLENYNRYTLIVYKVPIYDAFTTVEGVD